MSTFTTEVTAPPLQVYIPDTRATITFVDGSYTTTNPRELEVLRNHDLVTESVVGAEERYDPVEVNRSSGQLVRRTGAVRTEIAVERTVRSVNVNVGAPSANPANNKQAFIDASDVLPAAGGTISLKPYATYEVDDLELTDLENVTFEGEGATLVSTRVHAADQVPAFALYGTAGIKLRNLKLQEGNPIAGRSDRLYFENGELLRIGQVAGSGLFCIGVDIENCDFDGGYAGGLAVFQADEVWVLKCRGRNAFGDGMNATNCRRDVVFERVSVTDATDDLLIIKADDTTVPTGTEGAVIDGANVSEGDAKGISFINVADGKIKGVRVERTAAQGIAVWNDPGFPTLPESHKVIVEDFHIIDAGQRYGADTDEYLHAAALTSGHGLHFANGNNLKAKIGEIFNSGQLGAYAEGVGESIAFAHIDIEGAATGPGLRIGDPDNVDRTKFQNVRVHDVETKETVGGMMFGSATDVKVTLATVSSYKNGGSGSRRGILWGNVERFILDEYTIVNDDGGDETMLGYGTNPHQVIGRNGVEITGGARTMSYQTQNLSGATITPDLSLGDLIIVALTGTTSVDIPTNMRGGRVKFMFKQDATGGRAVNFAGGYRVNWTPDTGADKVNVIEFAYDHTSGYWTQTGVTTGIT